MKIHVYRGRGVKPINGNPARFMAIDPVGSILISILMPSVAIIDLIIGVVNEVVLDYRPSYDHWRFSIHPGGWPVHIAGASRKGYQQ